MAEVSGQVRITPQADAVSVEIDGKPFTQFEFPSGEAMKPFLHPLRSATGKIVTRHFPLETMEGEPKDHPHQRGLWFGHEQVNGVDFWNNETNYKTPNRGRIVVAKINETLDGPKAGVIKATLSWLDPQNRKLLDESRTMIFRAEPNLRIIDLDLTLTAAIDVTFGDAKDGALGVRLAAALQETAAAGVGSDHTSQPTGKITNAEGQEHEKAVWGKPSDWLDYSGEIDGEKVGVTVFDHPQNPRRARWHARGYGLLAANPFGLRVFTRDKSQDGSLVVKQGESLRLRYRVIIHPGDAKSAGLAALWESYIKQAQ